MTHLSITHLKSILRHRSLVRCLPFALIAFLLLGATGKLIPGVNAQLQAWFGKEPALVPLPDLIKGAGRWAGNAAITAAFASFTVNSVSDTVDAIPGDGICADAAGNCTLRAAIMEANFTTTADTITLPAGIYVLSLGASGENNAVGGDLDIRNGDLTIIGASPTGTVISARGLLSPNNERIFDINPTGSATVRDIVLRNLTLEATHRNSSASGGVINNRGYNLTLENFIVRDTVSTGGGAPVRNYGNGRMTLQKGAFVATVGSMAGAVWNETGTLTMANVTVTNTTNAASSIAGIAQADASSVRNDATATLTNVTFYNNRFGIYSSTGATTNLQNVLLAQNGDPTTGANCRGDITTYASFGTNFSDDGTCAGIANFGTNNGAPLLSDVTFAGGTIVVPPLTGSPVVNASGACPAVTMAMDQRGTARDGSCDIGAYEGSVSAPTVAAAPALLANTISGIVYRDYNGQGVRDTYEPGQSGITVTAYNAAGGVIATTTTAGDGSYSLNVPDGTPVRLEFTNLPTYLKSSAHGIDSGTTVQFLTSPRANASLGLLNPGEYANGAPDLATTCFVAGAQEGLTSAAAVVGFPYTAGSSSRTNGNFAGVSNPNPYDLPAHPDLAYASQVGAVWGLAYQRSSGDYFTGSFVKRHSGLLNGKTGVIYRIDAGQTVSTLLDLDTVFGANTAGANPHDTSNYLVDAPTWGEVGKRGLGDVDISEDDKTLYTINLFDRRLYQIPLAAPTSAARFDLPLSLPGATRPCATADVRPFGLGIKDGAVYVGMVCSAESTQQKSELTAYVYAFTPGTNTFGTAPVLEFPLTYLHGMAIVSNNTPYPADWMAWTPGSTVPANVAPLPDGGRRLVYPQPMLADIDFDRGDMVLAFMDRLGHQAGTDRPLPNGLGSFPYSFPETAGDLLRACRSGASWTIESNGQCGGRTTAGAGSYQGPGGGEYYFQDEITTAHQEVIIGGIVQVPGLPDVASAVYDPILWSADYNSGGIHWTSNQYGTWQRGYRVYDTLTLPNQTTFGKANGLGDLEAANPPAPIEIGNRIWCDTDRDGIQDAGELPIAGVTVRLYSAADVLLGTAITDAQGTYYFSSASGASTASERYGISGLMPNTTGYKIRLDHAADFSASGPLNRRILTTRDASGNTEDWRDSDGQMVNAAPQITLDLGPSGCNDHSYDFGFVAELATITAPAVVCENTGGYQASVPAFGAGFSYTWSLTNGTITSGQGTNALTWSATTGASAQLSVTIKSADCCQTIADLAVPISAFPSAVITAPAAVCATSTGNTASVANAGTGATYNWTITNGTITAGQGTPNLTWTASATSPVTLGVTVQNSNGCSASSATQVTINPLPSAVITAPAAVCATSTGNTASVANAGTGATYNWTITNGTITAGQGTPNLTWTASINAGPVMLAVTVRNALGCQTQEQIQVNNVACDYDLSIVKTASATNVIEGGTLTYTLQIRNAGPGVAENVLVTDPLPAELAFVSATPTRGSCTNAANSLACHLGQMLPGDTATVTLNVRVAAMTAGRIVTNVATVSGHKAEVVTINNRSEVPITIEKQLPGPGIGLPEVSSGSKPGALLIFPLYTSNASNPAQENTRITLTNTESRWNACVHLFFVDGATCSIADAYICLTPNQTAGFLASDFDPGTTGYLIAVQVDCKTGCPLNLNSLLGEASVKTSSGHSANLPAESYSALPQASNSCLTTNASLAELKLDGQQYNAGARVLAASSLLSPTDGNSTMLVLNRIGGNLATGAGMLGPIFGLLYDDAETPYSFTFNVPNACQTRPLLSNTFPRTTPRFDRIIPTGRTGWLKLWSEAGYALSGAVLTRARTGNTETFQGGHALHTLTQTTSAVLTIPVFPPACQ